MSGNTQGKRRRFGTVRKLPSGLWQARYPASDGTMRPAPTRFSTKTDAENWLVRTEGQMLSGDWIDPAAGRIKFDTYATQWMRDRDLKPRTRQEYERVLRLHMRPQLGTRLLIEVTPGVVRAWRTERFDAGIGEPTVAKAYRVLHAIFATAVDDEVLRRNPCRIKRAGQDEAPERPTATLDQVFAIVGAIQPRYRLLVLLATFAQLRFGELIGLRRNAISADTMELRVRIATGELDDGTRFDDDPKSRAGKRPISLPVSLRPLIKKHLSDFAEPCAQGRLFVGPQGGIPTRRNFNRVWHRALDRAGIPATLGLHLHDLRHTGSTWSAQSGATLKEIMSRIGHSSTRAAMIYQHATRERDQAIAAALDEMIEAALPESDKIK